jgi:ribonuclease T2
MRTRRLIILTLAGTAVLAALAWAQERRAPWPSEYFNPKLTSNVAGKFDYYTLVMSWSPTHCVTAEPGRDEEQCARADGLRYGFVLHGLWPQYEKGYPEACRIGRKPFVPETVISRMLDVMPARNLVIHEYKLHGTCSGLDPAGYYSLARHAFTRIHIPERYDNPFETQFASPHEVIEQFVRANPGVPPQAVVVSCAGPGNRLRDVRICMTKDGTPRACGGNEDQRKLCRADQMHVPPVRSTRRETSAIPGSTKPIPKRDPGLPRPRVIESPRRF